MIIKKFDTLFLDRDGVINFKLEGKYIQDVSEFKFIPGVLLAMNKLSTVFKRIIIVTNQQGIGKRIMSDLELKKVHDFMLARINAEGGRIEKIYYCPHLVKDDCNCRKPNPGMIQQAFYDYPKIDAKYSYLIGDSESDIQAGKQCNLHTVKVDKKYTLLEWSIELLSFI